MSDQLSAKKISAIAKAIPDQFQIKEWSFKVNRAPMYDSAWWNTQNDPALMLQCLGKQSDRKLVLFAVASADSRHPMRGSYPQNNWGEWGKRLLHGVPFPNNMTAETAARFWCGLKNGQQEGVQFDRDRDERRCHKYMTAERLRVMFGNPFIQRGEKFDSGHFKMYQIEKVRGMAQLIYDTEDWELMPVLADLVAESGLEDREIDEHLRQTVCPHCHAMKKRMKRYKKPKDNLSIIGSFDDDYLFKRPPIEIEEINDCLFCNGTGKPMRLRGDWVIDLLSGQE